MTHRRILGVQLLWLSLLICWQVCGTAMAATVQPATQAVQALENTLFAVQYDQEPMENRVGRLEETIFGQRQSGNLESRVEKLKAALSPSALGPLSPQQKNEAESNVPANSKAVPTGKAQQAKPRTSGSAPPAQKSSSTIAGNRPPSASPAPGESDYPTISQMELKLFGKTFLQDDITVRLARLEKDVFKVPQSGTLSDRMDNLQMVVLGDVGQAAPPSTVIPYIGGSNSIGGAAPYSTYTPPPYGQLGNGYNLPPQYGGNMPTTPGTSQGSYPGYQVSSANGPSYGNATSYPQQPVPGNYQPPAYGIGSGEQQASYQPPSYAHAPAGGEQISPDLLAAMDEVEKQVIGHTFPSEPIIARLDRLETKVFHATSPEMDPNERMQRVIAVASAGGAPASPQAKAKSTFQNLLPIILTILPLILL